MMDGVKRCSECVRRGRSCDGSGRSVGISRFSVRLLAGSCADVPLANRFIVEKRRIEREERATEEALEDARRRIEEAQRDLSKKVARLIRLRKQKEMVLTRGKEMVIHSLRDLDELERVEQEESEAVVDVQANGGADVIDWGSVFFDGGSGFGGPIAAVGQEFLGPSQQSPAGQAGPCSGDIPEVGGGNS